MKTLAQSRSSLCGNGQGLTCAEAQARLRQFSPNAVAEEKNSPFQGDHQTLLGSHSLASGGHNHYPTPSRRECRGCANRRVAPFERGAQFPSRRPRTQGADASPAAVARAGAGPPRRVGINCDHSLRYAEAGDFKRGIEFEEQALNAGHPTAADQKEIRERISLCKQSLQYRDKP